jgi:solute carrier family 8 (sodium/calcium exchanger)
MQLVSAFPVCSTSCHAFPSFLSRHPHTTNYFVQAVSGTLTFEHGETLAHISIPILDDFRYETDEWFTVRLTDPTGGATIGDRAETRVLIEEDSRFRGLVDRVFQITQRKKERLQVGTSTWIQQFVDALSVGGSVDDEGEELPPTVSDYIMHFFTVFWKVVFSVVPPTVYGGGWPAFVISLLMIGLVTGLVGEVATIFGCVVGLKDSVTAITFVALGTSLPDTFASQTAAQQDEDADASLGNITGSNSVNVFLGLGLPWVIASVYAAVNGDTYEVPAGTLGFSVTVFCVEAVICISVILLRRKYAGGELGGPRNLKVGTAVFFVLLWLIYIILSSLKAYNHI